jgi:hypothetical protein
MMTFAELQARIAEKKEAARSVADLPPQSPLSHDLVMTTELEQRWLCNQVVKMGATANQWCYVRSLKYSSGPGKAWTLLECDFMAATDYIKWKKQNNKR